MNWFPYKNKILRVNTELTYVKDSPVGYLAYPLLVGADGPVFMSNLELFF